MSITPYPQTSFEMAHAEVHIAPLAQHQERWRSLVQRDPQASLYHRESWLALLRQAYGFKVDLCWVGNGEPRAGALLTRLKPRLRRRCVSLPFSDYCMPLGEPEAVRALIAGLGRALGGTRIELRGVAAAKPWTAVDCFTLWKLDMDRSLSALRRAARHNFHRNVRRGEEQGVTVQCGTSCAEVERFYAVQVLTRRRLGLPSQPLSFFKTAWRLLAPAGQFEVWLASQGGRDVAGAILLRDGPHLHVKWAARDHAGPSGANHLLFWNLVEHHAGKARDLDLGRTDRGNNGLNRFKRELGAEALPLPYSFYPEARDVSSEDLKGISRLLSRVIQRLPRPLFRATSIFYRYLG